MFKDNENCGTKTEEATVQHVNQSTKLNPFAYLSSTSAKPVTSDQPMSTCEEESENSLMRENSTIGATVNEQKLYIKIINRVKNFADDNKKRVMKLWYSIGEDINNYFEGDYGESEMKKISKNTGIGFSTLYKATQFADKFTKDDFNRLLDKDFISFRLIVESFPIGRLRALQVFDSSNNAKEAQHKINEIKRLESAKGTTPDAGTDSKSTESETAPDSDIAADTVPEETYEETQPADQASSPTEPQSPEAPADVAQKQGVQDGQGTSVAEQPSSDKKTAKKKNQNTEADNNKEVSEPDISGQVGSPESFSYLFETMNKIGNRLINASVEKPANGDLRKIIRDTMMDLSNLLALVPEATCVHSGVTLSEGAAWESSCQSVALQV